MKPPLVSVIMSVHDQQDFVAAAIKSILDQTLTRLEFIIIDDASSKPVSHLLKQTKDKRVRIFRNRRQSGLAKSLNIGLTKARGKFIARMDADDISTKTRLRTQHHYLENHPKVAACGSQVALIDKTGRKSGVKHFPKSYAKIKSVIMRFSPFVHPTMMLRKQVIDEIGNYDEELNGAEDYDLWLRIAVTHPMVNLPNTLLKYRVNPSGVSWSSYKHTELQAIRARIKALTQYGYPPWQVIYLVKPTLSFFVPTQIKRQIFGIS